MAEAKADAFGAMIKEVEDEIGSKHAKSMAAYLRDLEKITNADYKEVGSFHDLCDILRDKEHLSKDNVELLLKVLRRCYLIKAAGPVEKYKQRWQSVRPSMETSEKDMVYAEMIDNVAGQLSKENLDDVSAYLHNLKELDVREYKSVQRFQDLVDILTSKGKFSKDDTKILCGALEKEDCILAASFMKDYQKSVGKESQNKTNVTKPDEA